MHAYQISQDSTQVTLAGITNVAIPVNASGDKAKYVLISSDDQGALFRPTQNGSEVISTLAQLPPNSYVILNVTGYTHLRVAQLATNGEFCISPLDNQ
jgi:hypothetical protein